MIQENLIRLFEDAIRLHWERPAMSDFGKEGVYTYADVAKRIEKLHILFSRTGLQKDDKVALIGRNSVHWAITYVATITYGAIVVPILQDFQPADITHIINHSEAKLLFAGDAIWEHLDNQNMLNVRAVFSLTDFRPLALQYDGLEPGMVAPETIQQLFAEKFKEGFSLYSVRYDIKENSEVASINYTSGTTGFSKGVITTLNNLAGNITFGLSTHICYPGSRFLSFLPLAHAYGCAFDFLCNFCAGGHTCYYGRPLAPRILLQAFAEFKPTTIFTVPLIIEKIYKKMIQPILTDPMKSWVFEIPFLGDAALGTIRKRLEQAFGGEFTQVIIGGAPLNAEVEEFFYKIHFPFSVGYGMTECAPLITFTQATDFVPHTCGAVLPSMQVRIVAPNPEGVGEIEVRGENVMAGYYKNEEATAQTFTEDGWLKTGDLGMLDEHGNLLIKGRSKTMLLGPSGQNIYPEEIEEKLNNLPYVSESLVVQVDDKLVALVCLDQEASDREKISEQQLTEIMENNRKELNKMVAAYEQINRIQIFPHEFEKTPKKSIKRFLYNNIVSNPAD